ncbi:MAG TPA: phage holin family protein [Pseudonocardiaceae bacterium]|nr:phage holin family protein [Pseudonocardiaceae bacterium]
MTTDRSISELLTELSGNLSRLARAEIRLAMMEVQYKAKRARRGGGTLGFAGMLGLFGVATLMACAVLGLATVMSAWLAALLVGMAAVLLAGLLALAARFQLRRVGPLAPEWAAISVREDIDLLRRAAHR